MTTFRVNAIHPKRGDIEGATLIMDHFGHNRHALRFDHDGMNGPYFSSQETAWEFPE